MNAMKFYETTQEKLGRMANSIYINDLQKYYELTDMKYIPQIAELDEVEQAFAQLALHGQNAYMISNIIKFKENYEFIKKELTCGFNPRNFRNKYKDDVNKIVGVMKNSQEINWNSNNSEKNPNAMAKRYAQILIDSAKYLIKFSSKKEILEDLKSHYKNKDYKSLIKYFSSQFVNGYSIALSCDFLKEYDKVFSDLPKPDVHIMEVMAMYEKKELDYYKNSDKKAYECIEKFQKLVDDINSELKKANEKEITVYQLDRMIWLICSGRFFLDSEESDKKQYLRMIESQ